MDWSVCSFHSQALNEGETFSLEDDGEIIVMEGALPRLINVLTREDLSDPVITLVFGRDGIPEDEVTFQVSREFGEVLMRNLLSGDSAITREVAKNNLTEN